MAIKKTTKTLFIYSHDINSGTKLNKYNVTLDESRNILKITDHYGEMYNFNLDEAKNIRKVFKECDYLLKRFLDKGK